MFGYIHANKAELSDSDKNVYKAYYCGLCRQLKETAGVKGQLLLNYDATFLVILLSALYECPNTEIRFNCPVHPASKHTAYSNEVMEYGAAVNIMLAYHSLMDDFRDNGSRSKKNLAVSIKKYYDIAAAKYKRQAEAIEKFMKDTYDAEQAHEENVDKVSGYTGEMLSKVFNWKDDEWKNELSDMGYYLGKFVYLMDAYEDREKDEKNGQYNPLIAVYHENADCYETLMERSLTSQISEAARSFERLPILQHASILRNVLYSGVWDRYEYLRIKSGRKAQEMRSNDKKKEALLKKKE